MSDNTNVCEAHGRFPAEPPTKTPNVTLHWGIGKPTDGYPIKIVATMRRPFDSEADARAYAKTHRKSWLAIIAAVLETEFTHEQP